MGLLLTLITIIILLAMKKTVWSQLKAYLVNIGENDCRRELFFSTLLCNGSLEEHF